MSDTTATTAPEPVTPTVPGPALNIPAEALPQAPSQDATPAQPEAPSEEGKTEDQKPKPKRPASERISELYGRTKMAERERDMALVELQRLRQVAVPQQTFDQMSFDEQQREIVRQAVREERAAEIEAAARLRHSEAEQFRALQMQARVEAAREVIPDLDEKISDPTLPISEYAARVIEESEVGPQMAYYLANNRDHATRISRLPPTQQAFELGQIAARISAAPMARKVSQAPAPVPTVGGGGGAGAKDPRAMSVADMQAHLFGSRR